MEEVVVESQEDETMNMLSFSMGFDQSISLTPFFSLLVHRVFSGLEVTTGS